MKYFVIVVLFFAISTSTSLLIGQWTKQTFSTTENLWKVRFATEQTGWIAGNQYIYKTTNGGSGWSKQDTSIGFCDAMFVLNDQTVMFENWQGTGMLSGGIRRTTDGGTTWTTANSEKNYYSDIDFGSATVGYASSGGTTGKNPLVKKTTDAGATWITISQNFPKAKYELTGIAFVDEQNGWTVSYDGFVYKTANGGIDWQLQDSLDFDSYRDIDFFDANYGWIVGGIGGYANLAYTTNGGLTWIPVFQNGSSIREVEIIDDHNAWFGGALNFPPYIAHLDSIGSSWKIQEISSYLGVESIDMVNQNFGYAVGPLGTVYKTSNGGISSVVAQKLNPFPNSFTLEQNYPNPFNPTTTIQFSISKNNFVSLKIFSVTGELIEELLHQTMDEGTYSIQWNAGLRPSGVYFYTITTGSFSETKKIMLIK